MKQSRQYTLIIPYGPDSLNQHYFGTRQEMMDLKLRWEQRTITVLEQATAERLIPYRFTGTAEFFFRLYFENPRNRDLDNYFLIVKGIMDAFVTTAIVKDDNYRYVLQNGMRIFLDPERPRIELDITHRYDDRDYVSIAKARTDEAGAVTTAPAVSIASDKK